MLFLSFNKPFHITMVLISYIQQIKLQLLLNHRPHILQFYFILNFNFLAKNLIEIKVFSLANHVETVI
jgi:hypothetical protein